MSSSRLRRPPATVRFEPMLQPAPTMVFQPYSVAGKPLGRATQFTYKTQYVVNVNPVKEPPRPIVPSLSQPVSVAGWRRMVETHMGVPFLQRYGATERVHHTGRMAVGTSRRNRMFVPLARGWTYQQPAQQTGPGARTVSIGGR